MEEPDLQLVQIWFNTATFDEIERDLKMTAETLLAMVGGFMGLFTGFSVLSFVEILYHGVKAALTVRRYKHIPSTSGILC